MLPYRKGGPIDYASLEFDAFKKEVPPDHMEQSREIHEVMGLLFAHFTDFHRRPDVFVDTDTNVCYDPSNLNVRVAPDVYIAFGVDAESIRPVIFTCRGRLARYPTGCWKSLRTAQGGWTWFGNLLSTLRSASRNSGGSTRREAVTTAFNSTASSWWMASTSP